MSETGGFPSRLAPPDPATDSTEVGILIEAFNADASTTAAESLDHRKIFWQRRIAVLRRKAVRAAGLEIDLEATRRDLEATRRDLEATRQAAYLQSEAAKRAEDELRGYRQHAANLEELLKSSQARNDLLARSLAEITESRAWRLTQIGSRAIRRLRSIFRGSPRATS